MLFKTSGKSNNFSISYLCVDRSMKDIKNARDANRQAKSGGKPVQEAKDVSQRFSNNIQNITSDIKEQVRFSSALICCLGKTTEETELAPS